MNRMIRVMRGGVGAAAVCALIMSGCGKGFTAIDMTVGPPAMTATSSVTYKVDVVGVTEVSAGEIESANPAEWFASSGAAAAKRVKYKAMTKSLEVRSGSGAQALKRDDPIWSTWRAAKVTRLHVIVDPPPGVSPDAGTWTREVAPMSGTWANDEVKVWVDASGVRLDRSPLPDK